MPVNPRLQTAGIVVAGVLVLVVLLALGRRLLGPLTGAAGDVAGAVKSVTEGVERAAGGAGEIVGTTGDLFQRPPNPEAGESEFTGGARQLEVATNNLDVKGGFPSRRSVNVIVWEAGKRHVHGNHVPHAVLRITPDQRAIGRPRDVVTNINGHARVFVQGPRAADTHFAIVARKPGFNPSLTVRV